MTETLDSLLAWTHLHPALALGLLFVFGFFEYVFVVGLFLPGVPIMWSFGALCSLGALEFWPVYGLVTLGAVCGDTFSYFLGRHFGERLFATPFFLKRPKLLHRGRSFFQRHGGKGVVFVHLLGPLRSLLPAVAGAYGMRAPAFLSSAIVGAALWALVYLFPGLVLGASLGLAAEVTRRLAILMLTGLITLGLALWLTVILAKLLARNGERWLLTLMDYAQKHRPWKILGDVFTQSRAGGTPVLAALGSILIALCTITLALLWAIPGWPTPLDLSLYQAALNLREPWSVAIAAQLLCLGEPETCIAVAGALVLLLLRHRRWRGIGHLAATLGFGALLWLVYRSVPGAAPPEARLLGESQDFALVACLYGYAAVLLATGRRLAMRTAIFALTVSVLLLLGLARLYLGELWLSGALITVTICAVWTGIVSVSLRRRDTHGMRLYESAGVLVALTLALVFSGSRLQARVQAALPEPAPKNLAMEVWWNNGWQQLPGRRVDVAGRDKQFLNLQWSGELGDIEAALRAAGWSDPPPLNIANGLQWLSSDAPISELPLLPRIHAGHYEMLVLKLAYDADRQYLLRLWTSGYRIDDQPLWIGSLTLQRARPLFRMLRVPVNENFYTAALASLTLPPELQTRSVARSPGAYVTRLIRPRP